MSELHQTCAAVCSNVREMTTQVRQCYEREPSGGGEPLLLLLTKATKWAVHHQNPSQCTTDNKQEIQKEPAI